MDNTNSWSNGCVVCFIGLPGCGKTTLSKILEKKLKEEGILVTVLSFDNEIPWKPGDENPSTWKQRRREVLLKAKKELEKPGNIIIIDDNNYYRSMRFEFYKIAREGKGKLGFCQVYLEVETEEAVKRNGKRNEGERVPSRIIERMSLRLEIPQPENHNWEKRSLILQGDISNKSVIEAFHFIIDSVSDPVIVPLEKVESTSPFPSSLHLADLSFRALVKDSVTSRKTYQSLNNTRKILLTGLKSGQIKLPEVQCINNPKEIQDIYYNYFRKFFE